MLRRVLVLLLGDGVDMSYGYLHGREEEDLDRDDFIYLAKNDTDDGDSDTSTRNVGEKLKEALKLMMASVLFVSLVLIFLAFVYKFDLVPERIKSCFSCRICKHSGMTKQDLLDIQNYERQGKKTQTQVIEDEATL